MSGEDDTFDIDIYGDDTQDLEQQAKQHDDPEDNLVFDDDLEYSYEASNGMQSASAPRDNVKADPDEHLQNEQKDEAQSKPTQQGTKRKAENDEAESLGKSSVAPERDAPRTSVQPQPQQQKQQQHPPLDPLATPALKITELHWWTTEEDLRAFCAAAKVEAELQDLSFGEHKINGKSRGEAYLEFRSAAAAAAVKHEIERKEVKKEGEEAKRVHPFSTLFTTGGNPFRGRDSGAQGKKDYSQHAGVGGRGGAYNNQAFGNRGGTFNRGGGFQRGGGSFARGGGFQAQQSGGGSGWGTGNNMGGNGGGYGAQNPMMSNPMMMGGMGGMNMAFNSMGRGGGMMGRGGMGGLGGMGGMNGMGNLGGMGMSMGGRGGMGMSGARGGGWGGGNFQQGGMGQGGYGAGGGGYGMGMQGGPANKRMRNE